MGNQLAVGGSLKELHLQDLGEGLAQDRILGGGRLLKSVQCWTEDGLPVIVKVYLKKEDDPPLAPHHNMLKKLSEKLNLKDQPNVLFYHRMVETDKAGYLVRQYFYSNLSDRISTRPFFTHLGKKWIAYQILQGVHQIHKAGFYHGDLKPENVVLTGWDWVFLTDLSPFKPTTLPADDPRDFSYYFDNRTCFLAPERFTDSHVVKSKIIDEEKPPTVTESMDIFSVGCILAQLFLDGVALFDLSQLLAYRKGETDHLNSHLQRIEDEKVREMIAHMLQLDPQKRYSAMEYMEKFSPDVFPPYFSVLHEHVMSRLVIKDCDQRVLSICSMYDTILEILKSKEKIAPELIKKLYVEEEAKMEKEEKKKNVKKQESQTIKVEDEKGNENNLTKIEELMKDTEEFQEQLENDSSTSSMNKSIDDKQSFLIKERIVPGLNQNKEKVLQTDDEDVCEGMEIIIAVLCSSFRNAKSVPIRVQGLSLLQKLAVHSTNYNRIQRLIPYTCVMLSDPSPLVKCTAIKTLSIVLEKITSFPLSEINLFNDYIAPTLRTLSSDPSDMVRVTFAEYLPLLAYQARRFLEMGQLIKQNSLQKSKELDDEQKIMLKGTYDSELNVLQDEFGNSIILHLSTDPCTDVKRALLKNITLLCVFYGRKKTNNFLLPMVITFLNSKEWQLRHALFEQIVGLAVFVGPTSLSEFILPCIVQALYDVEEFVTEQALNGLVCLCELGMFDKHTLIQMAKNITPLLHHPNTWIRYGAVAYFSAMSKQLGLTDTSCFLLKILKPHLDYEIILVTEYSLLEALKSYLPRDIFDRAVQCLSDMSHIDKPFNENETIDKLMSSKIWTDKLGMNVSQKDAELLDLMRPYLEQVARTIQSKMWDQINEQEYTSEVIKIDAPVQIRYTPVSSQDQSATSNQSTQNQSITPSQHSSNRNSHHRQTVHIENQFNKEWNAMFNKPNPKKLYHRRSIAPTLSQQQFSQAPLSSKHFTNFRPKGYLISQSHEHRGSVNELAVHENKQWFVSGGSDGTVKFWDSRLLDRDFSLISKRTYTLSNTSGRIMSVCIVPSTTPIVGACTDRGWVHLLDSETGQTLQTSLLSNKGAEFIKETHDAEKKSCVNVIRSLPQQNTVICGTQNGILIGLDHRMNKQAFLWKTNETLQQGPIMAICGGEYWMITGTRRGFLTLWDLRFEMAVHSWRACEEPIYRLGVFENNNVPSIYVTSETVTIWDLESLDRTAIYQLYDIPIHQNLEDSNVDSTSRTSTTLNTDPFAAKELQKMSLNKQFDKYEIRALEVCPDGNFFTGGTDLRIRFFETNNFEQSYIVSRRTHYEIPKYEQKIEQNVKIIKETIKNDETQPTRKGLFNTSVPTHHLDTIMDVKLIGCSYPILASCSRDGVVKLFK